MKLFILIIALVSFQQLSIAQDSTAIGYELIAGRWDAIYDVEESNLSDALLEKTKNAKVAEGDNHNIAILTIAANGDFDLMSIQDYGASDEHGLFELSEDNKLLTRHVLMPNGFDRSKRHHVQKKKSSVLYLEGDVMVIKYKKQLMYLKRTA